MPGAPNFNTSEVRTNASIRVEPISPLPFAFVWCQNASGFPREIDFQEFQKRLFQRNGEDIDSAGFVYEILETLYQGKRVEKKLSQILNDIDNCGPPRSVSRVVYSQNTLASCLRKIEKHPKYAGHVSYKRTETKRVWILNIP
jgi:hypothetical protein